MSGRAHFEAGIPIPFLVRRILFEKRSKGTSMRLLERADSILMEVLRFSRVTARSVVALSPVRTKPKRTYDLISDEFTPEGDHIPVLLARILQGEDASLRARLLQALSQFGLESTLFKGINVKSLGKRPSDPFQILVSLAGPAANLLDVGYGVSQALPVIVQAVVAQQSNQVQMLLQQPEVHLHPRGQAALGTFFAQLVANKQMGFVVETHSDYLVDRVRREIAQRTVSHRDVLILFFEKKGIQTKIHEIHLDKKGNVVNPPPSYRAFFLEEETKLMFRAAK